MLVPYNANKSIAHESSKLPLASVLLKSFHPCFVLDLFARAHLTRKRVILTAEDVLVATTAAKKVARTRNEVSGREHARPTKNKASRPSSGHTRLHFPRPPLP